MNRFLRNIIAAIVAVIAIGASADVKDLPVTTVNGKIYHYYKVKGKESIYAVAHKLKVAKDELIRYNPSADEGLKDGMVLYYPFDDSQVAEEPAPAPAPKPEPAPAPAPEVTPAPSPAPAPEVESDGIHLVKRGETIYALARRYGVSEEDLMKWNPSLAAGLKADSRIYVRDPEAAKAPAPAPAPAPEPADPLAPVDDSEPSPAPEPEPESTVKDDINIALILPFMTDQETPGKQAMRFTEFYKGFLIAVDSLRDPGKTINILALDSHGSTDTVRHLLSTRPELKEMDVVIAPDNAAQMAYIARWGLDNNIKVLNTFVIKDDTYTGNPAMLQSNIPSELMLEKAAAGFIASAGKFTPVILSRKDAEADKADFLKELNKLWVEREITPVVIEFDNKLSASALADLDATGDYFFIPVTGKQAEVNKILPAIIEWHRSAPAAGVKVWGYPEWIAFRGETLQNMHSLNTTIYSRFAPDEDSARNRQFDAAFKHWYGSEMENATPRQGLLGFDTGMYLLRLGLLDDPVPSALRYRGIQNDYDFRQVDGGGWVNNSLMLITYSPGGVIRKLSR